ncbi:hypothetical protein Pr1d_32500 [Bythopirellula goksoeyrii]|uniref:Uncharacterized protein n=2 Tax=Bythopirellula goksoeyrii TaxID=1400387 RepID=A0A5B9QEM4_9BACT|nr:hypothetical protein Pr1d_32500 [Bythopirellula goksoeyrii]
MGHSQLRRVIIDQTMFSMAFERDVDFQDVCPISTYLDLESGEVEWIYENDEDAYMEAGISPEENSTLRERTNASPQQYLEIPGLDHGDHHELLREFLDSDWTENMEDHTRARIAYSGSIGGWKKSVNDDRIVHAFYDYRERKTQQLAEEFLREHGVEPEWK